MENRIWDTTVTESECTHDVNSVEGVGFEHVNGNSICDLTKVEDGDGDDENCVLDSTEVESEHKEDVDSSSNVGFQHVAVSVIL
ncbi:hypothetical protein L1049_002546 [Liquidambar formosana]|uniref:Uncharacterized protein n=1 Tax=Liquidambar formosana TaxID=63359 RepID=A0AAP0R7I0_LIQFO